LYELSGIGSVAGYSAGSHLFSQDAPADHIFEIKTGLVATFHITATGDRRIIDFYTAGQLIGIAMRGTHRLSCQAITRAEVVVFSRKAILNMTSINKNVVKKLWSELISEHLRQEQHIVWLGSAAQERVASFLLAMADQCGEGGLVELPMIRRELAEYLGLTVETISRLMTSFRAMDVIVMLEDSNRIKILDRGRLEQIGGYA
jgi:CRP-like cAMP-binding protein